MVTPAVTVRSQPAFPDARYHASCGGLIVGQWFVYVRFKYESPMKRLLVESVEIQHRLGNPTDSVVFYEPAPFIDHAPAWANSPKAHTCQLTSGKTPLEAPKVSWRVEHVGRATVTDFVAVYYSTRDVLYEWKRP
jgi:hypothetical protein